MTAQRARDISVLVCAGSPSIARSEPLARGPLRPAGSPAAVAHAAQAPHSASAPAGPNTHGSCRCCSACTRRHRCHRSGSRRRRSSGSDTLVRQGRTSGSLTARLEMLAPLGQEAVSSDCLGFRPPSCLRAIASYESAVCDDPDGRLPSWGPHLSSKTRVGAAYPFKTRSPASCREKPFSAPRSRTASDTRT